VGNFAPPLNVEAPERTPLPFGLFSVVTPRPAGELRWLNGVVWEPLSCSPASGIGEPDCEPGAEGETVAEGLPKQLAINEGPEDASAFTIYGMHVCSPVGRDVATAQDRARQHLMAREEARVEQALMTGDLDNLPSFQGATDLTSGGPVTAPTALALLEGFIASNYGSLGVIHVSRTGATRWAADDLLVTTGSRITTKLGTPVVAGAGYEANVSPAGAAAAADTVWAYATPAPFAYRSDIFVPSAENGDLLDRAVNNLYAIAERNYLVGWDPCGVGAANFNLFEI